MANAEVEVDAVLEKRGKLGFLIGLVLAILVGAGGFYAGFSGMIPNSSNTQKNAENQNSDLLKTLPAASFIPLDPLIVNIRSSSRCSVPASGGSDLR
jgi:flagellar FliL protein